MSFLSEVPVSKRGKKASKPETSWSARLSTRTAVILAALLIIVGVVVFAAQHRHGTGAYQPRPKGTITYSKDIAPILYENCTGCHRPGQSAPCNLIAWQEVRRHAQQIAEITRKKIMPPWLPEPGHEELAESRSLTPNEIGLLGQWAAEGAREGNPADLPPVPKWPENWELGTPDLVVKMPEAFNLPADGKDVYRNFVIPVPTSKNRYVRAFEFRADSKAVHHAFLRIDTSGESRRMDAREPGLGFDGMIVPPSDATPSGHFLSWQPGRRPTRSPEGLEWTLPASADLVLLLHMQPRGKQEQVQASIAFYLTDVPPTNSPVKMSLNSYEINIPGGATNYMVEQKLVLPVDTDLLGLLPHAHYLARRIEGFADLPNGTRKELIVIPEWDFNWQSDFQFVEPVLLPKGTTLGMHITYDNSTNNFRNPHHPPVPVVYGLQTTNEMAELHFQMLAHNPAEQEDLRRAANLQAMKSAMELTQHHVRENPNNAESILQLGKMLYLQGNTSAGEPMVQRAIALNPTLSDAHYTLGSIFLGQTKIAQAEAEFLQAVRLDPQDYKARNNAGLCCLRLGKWDEAAAHFQEVIRLHPGDAIAEGNLDLVRQARRGASVRN
ncbi:MAG TPA: tetratricopeptide repeat protein [Candidatus Saccharimonadales bacterium]|nr:tetratricopeptide repeat protein [Candidatus Saccharimonadales bacterium]